MKSIIQTEKECFVCKTTYGLEDHHCIYGSGFRKLSEKYGLKVWLCKRHHTGDINGNKAAVHFNRVLDGKIKQVAQRAFMEHYPDKDFMEVFGRNYLEG